MAEGMRGRKPISWEVVFLSGFGKGGGDWRHLGGGRNFFTTPISKNGRAGKSGDQRQLKKSKGRGNAEP